MDYLIFYRVQEYFYVLSEREVMNGHGLDKKLLPTSDFRFQRGSLEQVFLQFNKKLKRLYRVYSIGDSYVVENLSFWRWLFSRRNTQQWFYQYKVSEFRLNVRRKLFDQLSKSELSLKDILDAYKLYTLQDEFSLWEYNSDTEAFTCVAATFHPDKEYIRKDEESSLNDVLSSDLERISRSPINCSISQVKARGMIWMTRIYLKVGAGDQPAVLTFYSRHSGLSLQDSVIKDIKSLVEMRFNNDIKASYKDLYHAVRKLFESPLVLGKEEALSLISKIIKDCFKYEASSAFSVAGDEARLIATFDEKYDGIVSDSIVYDLSGGSLTAKACKRSDSISVIYDVENHDANSHVYNEVSKSRSKNWVGIPIALDGVLYGFIRVKNKYQGVGCGYRVHAPTPDDHFNLLAIKSLSQVMLSVLEKYRELSAKLESHDEIAKVYRHEIRGPVGSIVSIPSQIIDEILLLDCDDGKRRKIISKLEDLTSLASNLAFIVRAQDVEKLIDEAAEEHVVSILKDVVIPIEKITKDYFRNKYDTDIIFDHDSFRGISVLGSQDLLQMIFYALLENSGKYQYSEGGHVKVYCISKTVERDVAIRFENEGVEILEDEIDSIFEKDFRGEVARSLGIDGSGIGLWLCKKIARKFHGDIVVSKRFHPVIFDVILKNARGAR